MKKQQSTDKIGKDKEEINKFMEKETPDNALESEGSATAFEQTENVSDYEGEFNNTLHEK